MKDNKEKIYVNKDTGTEYHLAPSCVQNAIRVKEEMLKELKELTEKFMNLLILLR